MEQPVGRDDIVESFRAALRIDGAADIREIAQEVEAIEHKGEVAVHEFLCYSCVPH